MKNEFRVIIAGSRDFKDYNLLKSKCNTILKNKITTHNIIVISGTCRGADKLGEKYAKEMNFKIEEYPADWNNLNVSPCIVKLDKNNNAYNALAGNNRNKQMANIADAAIIFIKNNSSGSKDMYDISIQKGLLTRLIKI